MSPGLNVSFPTPLLGFINLKLIKVSSKSKIKVNCFFGGNNNYL